MTTDNDPLLLQPRHITLPASEEAQGSIVIIPEALHQYICFTAGDSSIDPEVGESVKAIESSLSEFDYKLFLSAVRFSNRLECSNDLFIRVPVLASSAKVSERSVRLKLANFCKNGFLFEHDSKNSKINNEALRRRKLYEFLISKNQLADNASMLLSNGDTKTEPRLNAQQTARAAQLVQREAITIHNLPTKTLSKKQIDQMKTYVFYEDSLHQLVPYIGDEQMQFMPYTTNWSPITVDKMRVTGRQKGTDYGIVTAKDLQIYYAISQFLQDYVELNYDFFKVNVFSNKFPVSVFKVLEYCRRSRNSDVSVKDVHTAILRLSTTIFEIKPDEANDSPIKYTQYRYIEKAELLSQTVNLGSLSKSSVSEFTYDEPHLQNALNSIYLLTVSDEFVTKMFEGRHAFPFPVLSLKTHPLLFKIYVMLRNAVRDRESRFPWRVFIQRLYLEDVGRLEFFDRLLSTMKDIRVLQDSQVSLESTTESSFVLKLWGYECYLCKTASNVIVTLNSKSFNDALQLPHNMQKPIVDNKLLNLGLKRQEGQLSLSSARSERLESLTDEFKVDMNHYIATPTQSGSVSCVEMSVVGRSNETHTFYLDFYYRDDELQTLAKEIVQVANLEFSLVMHRLLDIKAALEPIVIDGSKTISQFEFNFFLKSSEVLKTMSRRQRFQFITLLDIDEEVRKSTVQHYLETEAVNEAYVHRVISNIA